MSVLLTPEEKSFIDNIRLRHITKDPPVTLDEMKRSILLLRHRRVSDVFTADGKPKTSRGPKKAPPTAAQIASALDDFDNF